jgi:hypothetical protein
MLPKMLDPDPDSYQMNTDPQPWSKHGVVNPQEKKEHERNVVTFRAAPLDGGYADTALHDLVELGLDVQLRVLRLDALQLDRH